MRVSIRQQWDYFAIAFVLGLFLTGAVALAISVVLALEANL